MVRRGIQRLAASSIFCLTGLMSMHAGCGFERLRPELPDLVEGLSLEALGQIQNDERLTDEEKREAIRTAAAIPETTEGDRLVDFLLTFDVP
ncbi:MAG TPA: hypothetical protein VNT79_11155 [Phycisphaerae bacterium]|nr:hypothetical protein [Phycisphaerae bacterium]